MTTQIPAPAAAAREAARQLNGQFGTHPAAEADLELDSPAPVAPTRPSLAGAPSAFGEQTGENSWEYLPGEQIRAAITAPMNADPVDITGSWTANEGTHGGRLDVQLYYDDQGLTLRAPTAVAAVSDLTARLDRTAGHHVPYRRDDRVTDEELIDVTFGASPAGYPDHFDHDQRRAAAEAFQWSVADYSEAVLDGRKITPAEIDAAARCCYDDALAATGYHPARADAQTDISHPQHGHEQAAAWGRCAAATHFLTRGQGSPIALAETLYAAALTGRDADAAWEQAIDRHGEHTAPAHGNTGACTNRPGERARPARKPSLFARLTGR